MTDELPSNNTNATNAMSTPVQPRPPMQLRVPDTIFIGKKEVMDYVLAVVTQFGQGSGQVIIKARGQAISRAVDVAEVVRHRFMPDLKVKTIGIGSEELTSEDGRKRKVSTIEIVLAK